MRTLLIVVATVLALAYAGACGFLHARQRELIYYGWATTTDARATDFALERPDATLRGWVVNPGKPDPILYFGGNAERVEANREAFARMFPGRSVYLLAYRGYGASEGTPSEAALVADAVAFHDEVRKRHPGQKIAAIGRSLGSGVASQLAAHRPLDRLVLVTPFDSLVGAAGAHYPIFPVDWLLEDRYDSTQALHGFAHPLLIVHGGRDEIVPPESTQRLIDALSHKPQTLRIPPADHNDISGYSEYEKALARFLH
jgi:hypothetical protein